MTKAKDLDTQNANLNEEDEKRADYYFEKIKSYIEENHWIPTVVNRNDRVFIIDFSMRYCELNTMIIVDNDSVTFNTILPVSFSPKSYIPMAIAISQINMDLKFGAFHPDEDDGEVSYRFSYSIIKENHFNKEVFENYFTRCLITPDIYFHKIIRVATGKLQKEEQMKILNKIKDFATTLIS